MSNLTWTRPLGVWNAGVIRAAELADLDQKTVKAPNMVEGSTHAPSSPVYVGGSGMQIRLIGSNVLDGGLTVHSGSAISCEAGSFIGIYGEAGLYGATHSYSGATWLLDSGTVTTFSVGSILNVEGGFYATRLDAGIVDVTGALITEIDTVTSLGGSLTVSGPCFFQTVAHFYGSSYFHSETAYFENQVNALDVTVNGELNARGDITLIAGGSLVERVVIGTGADGTYSVSTADLVFILASTPPGGYTYHVDAVGAVEGKRMRFCLEQDIASSITVQLMNNLGGQIGSTILRNNSNGYTSMEIMFVAGVWRLISFCKAFLV